MTAALEQAPLTYRQSYRLLASKQKRARGASYYSRFVNRPAGRSLAAAAALTPLTPNHISLLSGAMSLLGIMLIALGPVTAWSGLAVWAALALGFALDSADGQLARLKGGGSLDGEWLDHVLDAGKQVLVHAAVLVGWYRSGPDNDALLLVPLGYLLVSVVLFVAGTLAELLRRRGATDEHAPQAPSAVTSAVLLVADFGALAAIFLLWGFPSVFFPAYSLLGMGTAGVLVLLLAKWYAELACTPR